MALSCHDRWPLSSLAFVREWTTQPKLFSVRGFAARKVAVPSSGFVGTAIAVSNTAATIAAAKRAGSSVELQTFVIGKLRKGDWINGIDSRAIGHGWQQIPLWIKVPPSSLPLAISSRRCFTHRSSPKMAAYKHTKPE